MSDEFRFESLLIWQKAADLAVHIDELSDSLDQLRKYKFAEQFRSAGISISNNIAEGSGSNSKKDFLKFLYIARKSTFECASMALVFKRRNYLSPDVSLKLVSELNVLSRMIVSFGNKL